MRRLSLLSLPGLLLAGLLVSFGLDLPAAEPNAQKHEEPLTPAAYVLPDYSQHIFYRGSGGAMMELSLAQSDARWQQKDLTKEAGAPKAASNPACYFFKNQRTQHVVYRCEDGQIEELYRAPDSDRWMHNNLTMATKAPKAVGELDGFARDDDNTQHIYFRTAAGDICELFFLPKGDGRGWHSKDLTAEAQSPKADSSPTAYFVSSPKSQHVVYRDKEGQIHELYWSENPPRWMHNNLTTMAGTAKAAGDPFGICRDDDNTQHVFFRTHDGNVCELFYAGKGKGWTGKDLSAEAKAPKAAGDPAAYFMSGAKSQHVLYRDKEGQIHELFLAKDQGRWATTNLSADAKAPKATGDPIGYGVKKDNSQHVAFPSNGKICQLTFVPNSKDRAWHAQMLTEGMQGR